MFGSSRLHPIEEHEASGELERVYHDIRQVMRVSGVNLNFRTWAAFERSFPLVWAAVRDNAGTYAFEHAADHLRAAAVKGALALPPVQALSAVPLGESQTYQIGAALALYHYINPKLLLLTAAIRMVLQDDPINGRLSADVRKLPRGVPARMYPMEMVDQGSDDPHLKQTFDDMRQTLAVDSIDSDYRTLGLWPYYLAVAWQRLKPIAASAEHRALAESLRLQSIDLARTLPYRVKLTRLDITSVGDNDDDFIRVTQQLERALPGLMVNIALLTLEGTSPDLCMGSPFPVPERDADRHELARIPDAAESG
jgi:hypothetical protein